jgi:chitinase
VTGFRFVRAVGATAIALAMVFSSGSISAQSRDRTPPTAPTNLTVTATTAYSVSLRWNPSSDNSGRFSYVICCAYTNSATVAQTETTFTFTAGMEAGRSYSLSIYAVDAAGNASKYSNSVTFRLPSDPIPPTTPNVTVGEIGPTHVALSWRSTDNGPNVWYWIFKNGVAVQQGTSSTSGVIHLLEPQTTYTFTVQARDFAMNWSPVSPAVVVTTAAVNPNDHTPPTTPTNLRESHYDNEIRVTWDQSTDDFDRQALIRYNVFVNGVLSDVTVGSGRSIVYGDPGSTITVIAVDTAGNESAPATINVRI